MKRLFAALVLCAFAAAPAIAAEPAQPAAHAKRDPNEIVCKVQSTVAGIPQRVCVTRAEWERSSSRTRQELMMTQRAFCGGGASC